MIRVVLPAHLRTLARTGSSEVELEVEGPITLRSVLDALEARFPMLPETPDIYPAWKAVAEALGVIGKQVHDARLVAVCHVHAVTHLLTFNVAHFVRLVGFGPGVVVVDPASV